MNKDILRLRLQDFRAIKEADIKLDGITLVSGVNGCGKSTLSRLLYHIIDDANNYDRLIEERVSIKRITYSDTIDRFIRALEDIESVRGKRSREGQGDFEDRWSWVGSLSSERLFRDFSDDDFNLKDEKEDIAEIIEGYKKIYQELSESERIRLNRVLSEGVMKDGSTLELLSEIHCALDSLLTEVSRMSKERPSGVLWEELEDVFDRGLLKSTLLLSEYGTTLLGYSDQRLNTPVAIERAIYIDTPMSIVGGGASQIHPQNYRYWKPLKNLLEHKYSSLSIAVNYEEERIRQELREHILRGESSWSYNTDYIFTRADGKVFNLLECATGVKAFSIIQMLLRNGWLTRQTLLIIDEPEAHLHPQWIVEYARLIVLLNKHIGVKFFLASHSPDMVSAIKYISESEGVSDVLNFYLAEEVDQTMQYRYKPLGTDVEPIFASFNIALDRIDQYGASQTEPES